MSYRSVLSVSNSGPSNPKLTLKIYSLRIKHKARNFASWMFSEYAFKIGRKKGNDFFDHTVPLSIVNENGSASHDCFYYRFKMLFYLLCWKQGRTLGMWRDNVEPATRVEKLYLSWNLKFPNNNLLVRLITNRSSRRQTNNALCWRGFFLCKLSVTATEASQRSPAPRLDKINWKNCLTYPRGYRTNRQIVFQVLNSSSLTEFCTLLEELHWIDVRVAIDGWMPN